MDLPPPLRPWASPLSFFPHDLALALGPIVRRLSTAMGPMRVPHHADQGDVDGFDGLTRRGTYERLLMSEWLLADEEPDEFLRRAASGEHTFLRLAHPSPAGTTVSVALFDAGPDQLGRPRIVHLAALIVLARRAEQAGAPFAWGMMEDPEGPLFPGVAPAGVLYLLGARTASGPTPEHLEAWARRIGEWKELDDLWIVGGADRISRHPAARRASVLHPTEVLEVDSRRVTVRMTRGATRAEIGLELPLDPDCARLLRDPFRVAVAPSAPRVAPSRLVPASNPVFDSTGSFLLARSKEGGLIVYSIPRTPRASAGRPRILPLAGATVAAAGGDKNGLTVAVARDDGVQIALVRPGGAHSDGGRYLSGAQPFRGPDASTPLRPCLLETPALPVRGLIVDAAETLFEMTGDDRLVVLAARVSALTLTRGGVTYVAQVLPGQDWRLESLGSRQSSSRIEGDASHALFGHRDDTDGGLLAIEVTPGQWILRNAGGMRRLLLAPRGTAVVGVSRSAKRREEAGLVIVEDDGRSLSFVGLDWSRHLATAPARIQHAVMSPSAPHLAYTTERGDLFVYSLDHQTHLYQLLAEPG
jgi:hypothetical protein